MKRVLVLLLTILILISCQKRYNQVSEDDISLAKVYLNGKLRIGVNGPFAPLFFMQNRESVGYDVDVLNEVCAVLDVQPEYVQMLWGEKDELLENGTIDMIASGFSRTTDRVGKYKMSIPILQNLQCVIVRNDDTRHFDSIESLSDTTLGCEAGSTAENYIKDMIKKGSTIKLASFDSNFIALSNLQDKKIDAVIGDIVFIAYELQKSNIKNLTVLNFALQNEYYVYAFRKNDNALVTAVNEVLKEMAEDGVLSKITTKWFGSDISLIR